MKITWLPLLVLLSISVQDSLEKNMNMDQMLNSIVFHPMYQRGKEESDSISLPFRRETQLYSRNSGDHIRILPSRKIDAMGKDGDKYAKLIIESDSFGRVRIRGAATKLYLCIDKRRRLRARGKKKDNCIFREHFAKNAFTEFTSVNKSNLYIAFNRRGRQRACNKTRSGMKAVQFIERPLRFQWLYKGRKVRKNKRNGQIERLFTKQSHTLCIKVKNWREWRKFQKWRKQQKKLRRKQKSMLLGKRKKARGMPSTIPPMIALDPTRSPTTGLTSASTWSSSTTSRITTTKQ